MKVCLFSDVHGNLPAMEKMLALSADADLYISLGDIVNYGPWSNECVELLNSIKYKICIRGNHEDAFMKVVEMMYEMLNEKIDLMDEWMMEGWR